MDYADKKDMMDDDCDIEGFSVLEENIANGSQKIFVTKEVSLDEKFAQDLSFLFFDRSEHWENTVTHKIRLHITGYRSALLREVVEEIKTDLLNYRDERLDDIASITNIAIRIGLKYTPITNEDNLK